MKTPREILLGRHRAAEPKLDALRQRTLGTLAALQEEKPSTLRGMPRGLQMLLAFMQQIRWHLAGMSALWILAAWLSLLDDGAPNSAPSLVRTGPAPGQWMAALREHRRQVNELLNSEPSEVKPAAPPAALPPSRRGAWRGPLPLPATTALV